MQILLLLGLPNHPLLLQILLHALWPWWPHQYLCNDPSQQTGSRTAENYCSVGNFSAWFCISEWKTSQELQRQTEICKRKNLEHRHTEPHKLSGSDVDSFISTLVHCYFCPTSLGRGRPSPWKSLWKCLTSQPDREHFHGPRLLVQSKQITASGGRKKPKGQKVHFFRGGISTLVQPHLHRVPCYLLDAAQRVLRTLRVWDDPSPSPHSSAPAFRWRNCNSDLWFLYNIQVVSMNSEHSPSTERQK